MTSTRWTRERLDWVRDVDVVTLLDVIEVVAQGAGLYDTPGDYRERIETIRWLATRGRKGREWGMAAEPARQFGSWSDE